MRDAAVWGTGAIGGVRVAICVMDFGFMGGSMGAVVGEKVTRAAEHALAARIPLVVVSASGGARMQEGTLALMQLAKTLAALERLRDAGVPFLSVLSDPTTGGVFASFAAVGDVNVAEPDALIGFAGSRVSAGTIAQELPEGFQRSEFLFDHGFIDRVVPRAELRAELTGLLRLLPVRDNGASLPGPSEGPVAGFRPLSFLSSLAERVGDLDERRRRRPRRRAGAPVGDPRDAVWARVQLARNLQRPRTLEFVAAMTDDFVELHGDRLFGDDPAMVAGPGPARWPAGGRRRPAEGRRHRREHPAQLRDAAPGGLPQGDAGHGAGRALRAAGHHLRGRARRAPRAGLRGTRHRRGDRPLDRADEPPAHARSSRSSPARAARAGRSRSPSATSSSRSRTRSTRSSRPRAARRSCGGPPTRPRPPRWR